MKPCRERRHRAGKSLSPWNTPAGGQRSHGMVAAHRLKDLADVQELIREGKLPRTMAEDLNSWVRDKFLELWDAVDAGTRDDPY